MNWHKWTSSEHQFLIRKFHKIGDKKLAEIFNEKFPKEYPWTPKQIEKRRYQVTMFQPSKLAS